MGKIYLSIPMTTPLKDKTTALKAMFPREEVLYWDRHSNYTTADLAQSDAMVVCLPDNGFCEHEDGITRGVRSEIEYAYRAGIPIYLLYYSSTKGDFQLYETKIMMHDDKLTYISGLQGSYAYAPGELQILLDRHDNNTPTKSVKSDESWFA